MMNIHELDSGSQVSACPDLNRPVRSVPPAPQVPEMTSAVFDGGGKISSSLVPHKVQNLQIGRRNSKAVWKEGYEIMITPCM